MNWGPWIPWGHPYPPEDLPGCRMQAVYTNANGDRMSDAEKGGDRGTRSHIWAADDLPGAITHAYRLEEGF